MGNRHNPVASRIGNETMETTNEERRTVDLGLDSPLALP
jgi:hypothetical protein